MARYLLVRLLYCLIFSCYLGVSQEPELLPVAVPAREQTVPQEEPAPTTVPEVLGSASDSDPPSPDPAVLQYDTVSINVRDLPVQDSEVPISGLGPEVLPEPQTVDDTPNVDVKDVPVQGRGIPITGLGPRGPAPPTGKPGPLNCGPNEKATCVPMCPPERTCKNRDRNYRCKKRPCLTYRCACKPGYFRNSIGQCITRSQCRQCSKPHEYYACGGACDNVCSSIKYQNQTDCPIFNVMCNKMCYCDSGYARDKRGNCIPIKNCPPSCSDPNEEYVLSTSCPPDLCESLVARYQCDPNEKKKKRCRCKSGYFRKSAGSPCVPLCDCPQMAQSPECTNGSLDA